MSFILTNSAVLFNKIIGRVFGLTMLSLGKILLLKILSLVISISINRINRIYFINVVVDVVVVVGEGEGGGRKGAGG